MTWLFTSQGLISAEEASRAAAEPHAHRYLAPDASSHVQAGERVLVRVEVIGALALVVPGGPLRLVGLDLEPEVDRHRHAVEARTDVGDGGGDLYAHQPLRRAPS